MKKKILALLVVMCMLFVAAPVTGYATTSEHTHEAKDGWMTDDVYHWNECSGCEEKLNIGEHSYDEWTVTKEATMYDFGTKESFCSDCGNKTIAVILMLPGHTHVAKEGFETDADKHWIVCEDPDCGKILNIQGHVFGEWTVTKEATTTETGSRERVCPACNYKETEVIPMLEEPTTEEPSTEEPTTEEPTTEEPTTEEPTTEEPTTEEPSTEEPTTEEPTTEEPTTEEPSTEEPSTEEPSTEEPTTEEPSTEEPTTEEPSHTHDAVDGWKSDADQHWNECSGCEEKLNAADHTFGDWTITKNATTAEAGSKERVCSVCGYKEIGEMPIEVVPDTPPTGDAGSMILWILVAMVSCAAAMMIAEAKKRNIAR